LRGRKQLVAFERNLSPSQKHEVFHRGGRDEPPSSPSSPRNTEKRNTEKKSIAVRFLGKRLESIYLMSAEMQSFCRKIILSFGRCLSSTTE
jgi:hypothetical protein